MDTFTPKSTGFYQNFIGDRFFIIDNLDTFFEWRINLKNKISIFFIYVVINLFLVSCADLNDPLEGFNINPESKIENTDGLYPANLKNSEINFQTIKEKILDTNCINCHTGKHRNFDQYSIVKLSAIEIVNRLRTKNFIRRMPAGREPLSEDLIELFEKWVSLGTPDFTDENLIEQNVEFRPYYFDPQLFDILNVKIRLDLDSESSK